MSNIEGRRITIARIRAGMTGVDLARKLFCNQAYVSMWESGRREPWWDQLYDILPELPKIREEGCAKYCPKALMCAKDGRCIMANAARAARNNADIVQVVRCKDRIYSKPLDSVCQTSYEKKFMKGCVWCTDRRGWRSDMDYCSDGERGDDHG